MSNFLPTSKKEVDSLGWDYIDIILFTGDAYIDHPAFGAAVIARVLEAEGYRVAVVPQPNWRDDLRDFRKLGAPRLFFGVTSGSMDSMVNHYTAAKRLRSDDAYTPEGKAGQRPDRAVNVYCNILKDLYPQVPVVIGGIEASLRRERHYDYWDDCMMPPILETSRADALVAGMGEKAVVKIARQIETGQPLQKLYFEGPLTTEELDSVYDLPYTRLPHPRYKGKRIPAYDMIKFSITTHRGCFGGCNFCAITAHQGKMIQSRSEASILREVEAVTKLPDFRGTITDLGAPTANMYRMGGKDRSICARCRRTSCLFPKMCPNLGHDHSPLLKLYESVLKVPGVKHAYIGSGIRYDLFLDENGFLDAAGERYFETLVRNHTSGRLKVAPEHTEDKVLDAMAKPSFTLFERLREEFDKVNRKFSLKFQLVPYFMSGHPGCGMKEMEALSRRAAIHGLYMDQVQDFTPTPMTVSTTMFHTGKDPRTGKPVFVERNIQRKQRQKSFFFKKG
ncbi:MAG: DUF3362 domain-containing protein [Bacteroidales bacterium]|nr:DUF3362 domain-containing protein [Candidatus Cacconaster merdequi]